MCRLMYWAGLRLMETGRLRVKDIDVERGQLTVREGKGGQGSVRPVADGHPRRSGAAKAMVQGAARKGPGARTRTSRDADGAGEQVSQRGPRSRMAVRVCLNADFPMAP